MTAKSISKICSIDGCDRKLNARTWCTWHYNRWVRHGDPLVTKSPMWKVDVSQLSCLIADCGSQIFVKQQQLCRSHYHKWWAHGDATDVRHVHGKGQTEEERFWSKVDISDPSQCWAWKGSTKGTTGYGYLKFQGRRRGAHVVSWMIQNGRDTSLLILHSCDNRWCVNPSHLREGTHKENTQDMMQRGRHWSQK